MKYSNYVYHIYLSKGKKKNEKKVTFAQYLSAQYFYLPFFFNSRFLAFVWENIWTHEVIFQKAKIGKKNVCVCRENI